MVLTCLTACNPVEDVKDTVGAGDSGTPATAADPKPVSTGDLPSVDDTPPDTDTTPDPDPIVSCTTERYIGFYRDGVELSKVTPYSGELTSTQNFDYRSASVHPIIGPTPKKNETHLFLYRGSDGLTLNLYHHVDNGKSPWYYSYWEMEVLNNHLLDSVIFSDESNEFKVQGIDGTTEKTYYRGRFRYKDNTDGAIVGPLETENFTVNFSITKDTGMKKVIFFSGNGSSHQVEVSGALENLSLKNIEREICN